MIKRCRCQRGWSGRRRWSFQGRSIKRFARLSPNAPPFILTKTQAQRNPEEEGDYMAFEQLVAEAAAKKEKKKTTKDKKADPAHAHPASEAAADAPNVPRN